MQFTREESLARLRRSVSEGKPIIGAGAGTGISAKCFLRFCVLQYFTVSLGR